MTLWTGYFLESMACASTHALGWSAAVSVSSSRSASVPDRRQAAGRSPPGQAGSLCDGGDRDHSDGHHADARLPTDG